MWFNEEKASLKGGLKLFKIIFYYYYLLYNKYEKNACNIWKNCHVVRPTWGGKKNHDIRQMTLDCA